jgi:hypothetical protein
VPTTLNTEDQPPAESSDQKVSGLAGAVHRRHRHSALGYRTPAEYAAECRCTHTPVACEIN